MTTVIYVDREQGSDLHGDGSKQHPYRTQFRADMVRRNGDVVAYRDLEPVRRAVATSADRVRATAPSVRS